MKPQSITIPGPPVTRSISVEQVRAYLIRQSWKQDDHGWYSGFGHRLGTNGPLEPVIRNLAVVEHRHPSEMLTILAGVIL